MIAEISFSKIKKSIKLKLVRPRVEKRVNQNKLGAAFIVSHTRSGSSILKRVMRKHSQIAGVSETRHEFKGKRDIIEFGVDVYSSQQKLTGKENFIIDRIVSQSDMPNPRKFQRSKFIFLLREPLYSLPEIVKTTFYLDQSYEEAYKLYCKGLENITRIAHQIPSRNWEHITFKELSQDTGNALAKFEDLLKIKKELGRSFTNLKNISTSRKKTKQQKKHFLMSESTSARMHVMTQVVDLSKFPEGLTYYIELADKEYQRCLNTLKGLKAEKKIKHQRDSIPA